MVALYFIAGIMLLISIIFLMGRGANLISGYNMASIEDKQKYNKKRLTRVLGVGTLVIAITLFIFGYFIDVLPSGIVILILAIFIIDPILMLVFANTYAKIRTDEKVDELDSQVSEKNKKTVYKITGIFIVIALLGLIYVMFYGKINVEMNDYSMTISATHWNDYTIEFDEIDEIYYQNTMEQGRRVMGVGNTVINAGHFENKVLGDYILYDYTCCNSAIIFKIDGEFIVLGLDSKEATKLLYDKIIKMT